MRTKLQNLNSSIMKNFRINAVTSDRGFANNGALSVLHRCAVVIGTGLQSR